MTEADEEPTDHVSFDETLERVLTDVVNLSRVDVT